MKIFPHILSRVGGLPIKEAQSFSLNEYNLVEELLKNDVEILKTRIKISNEFQKLIERLDSPYLKSKMINAFRDFKKGRKRFEKVALDTDIHGSLQLVYLVTDLEHFKKSKNNIYQNFDKAFERSQIQSYKKLQKLSEDEKFQKGVLQSSQSFYHQIRSFQLSNLDIIRKKVRQTGRSLAGYIFRSATKTSPFSHFTTLDLMSLENGRYRSVKKNKPTSYFQINNFLLFELQEILLKELSFLMNMKVQLNPSLLKDGEEFLFIKNERNEEIFQTLEKSDFLELIYNKLNTEGEVFERLIKNILNDVEALDDEIKDYLLQLIDIGFIEFQWNLSGTTRDWEGRFPEWLPHLKFLENNVYYLDLINQLFLKKLDIKDASPQDRLKIQHDLVIILDEHGFSKTKPEIILFEDVFSPKEFSENKEDVKSIISTLDNLLGLLEPLVRNEVNERIYDLCNIYFAGREAIPLVKVYEKYFQHEFDKNKNTSEDVKTNLEKTVIKTGRMDSKGVLYFSIEDLKKENWIKTSFSQTYSGLFQLYKKNGETKAVINGISPGYGKLFGRFLHMLPDSITKELQEWNKEEYLLVENTDASYYNVNIHPPLVSHEIKMHHSQNRYSKKQQISISDFEVIREHGMGDPALYYKKNEKQKLLVEMVDLGFENPKARSPMFQLLNGFRSKHATYRIFLKMVNRNFVQESENGIRFYPRVVIDNHLILQRQSQIMDVSFFPKINKSDHASDFFYQMQKFKGLHNLPQYVFVQPIRDFSNPDNILKQDFYKPQFIDLHAPISIEILKSIIQKHQGKIKIEEMLPMPDQLDSEFVREDVIEWKRY